MTALPSLVPLPDGAGFVSVPAERFRPIVGDEALKDWPAFASSWNDLELDRYMADGGRFRTRRFASFVASRGEINREPHGPHFQSLNYNALNGGIDRWFAPVTEATAAHPLTSRLIRLCLDAFTTARGAVRAETPWKIEMHQFRIEPGRATPGMPTPEGMHRDGVEWVFVALIARVNVEGGITTVGDETGRPLGVFTLAEPLDAVLLDDSRVRHGVTPIHVLKPGEKAFRDVLVLTFRSAP